VAKQDGHVFTSAEVVTDTTRKLRISLDACNGDGAQSLPAAASSGPTGQSASRLPMATTAGASDWKRSSPRSAPHA
jgi:hypothetical protein